MTKPFVKKVIRVLVFTCVSVVTVGVGQNVARFFGAADLVSLLSGLALAATSGLGFWSALDPLMRQERSDLGDRDIDTTSTAAVRSPKQGRG